MHQNTRGNIFSHCLSNLPRHRCLELAEQRRIEKELLEAGFELSDLQTEKHVKASDAHTFRLLKELKSRCRGYYGQFFELIKPINDKYELAVKVALAKCLKFLVVDTAESAQMVNDFLSEKNLTQQVLILENIPAKEFQRGLEQKLDDFAGSAGLLYDVIDITVQDPKLEKALRFFTANKVVTQNFDMAAKLQQPRVCCDNCHQLARDSASTAFG